MLTYSTSMGICFLCTAALFCCNLKNWRDRQWTSLFWIYILVMMSSLSDALWKLIDGNPDFIYWNYFLNMIEFSTFGWIGYFWFCYCCEFDLFITANKKKIKSLAVIPAVIVTLFIVTTGLTGYVFYIDDNAFYQRGTLFQIQQSGYLYLVGAALMSLRSWKQTRLYSQRKHFFTMFMFIIPPALLGGIQLLFPPTVVPTLQFSIFISLLFQFADEQERKITHDSLTHLINRFEFEQILDERMTRCHKNHTDSLFLLMGDIDRFKTINDTLGHPEGDRVLQTVASVLRKDGNRYDAVAARISGDEFCLIVSTDSEERVKELIRTVSEDMHSCSSSLGLPLSISIGYARYEEGMTIPQFLSEADAAMYRVKSESPVHRA